ncbi:MAG: glycosyltransferase [Rhodospirillales bacterium]|nr:glycosyltransferase [Rhodospirillales bacterium]MDE2576397.1 glycosyltransferase [Rhodospirillales bacterium]
MKVLFIHQSFPAQYWRLVAWLRDHGHEVTFITNPTGNAMQSVRKVEYTFDSAARADIIEPAQEFEIAMRRAAKVASVAAEMATGGYRPDIILGHHGWGELLHIEDVWPDVPLLGYFEYYYRARGYEVGFDPEFTLPPGREAVLRAKNALNLIALTNPGVGQTPTRFQLGTYPAEFRSKIRLIEEGVDLVACAPDATAAGRPLDLGGMSLDEGQRARLAGQVVAPGEKLVTFVSRTLEPARGFHILMRALPELLARRDVRVAIVGRDEDGYGPRPRGTTWREYFLQEMRGRYDEARVHFLGLVDHPGYLRLLQRSDAHVYMTYPFVASWSLREALACGCAVVASDTASVHEFVIDGHNGLLTPFLDPRRLAERVRDLLENDELSGRLRRMAREHALAHLSLARTLETYRATIAQMTGQVLSQPGAAR